MKKMNEIFVLFCLGFAFFSPAMAQSEVEQERLGLEDEKVGQFPTPDPVARTRAISFLGVTGLLLIPESTNDRVMAFDPMTGDLIDPDFIPADPDNLSTPIHAVAGFDGNTILISDQLEDVVQAYDLDGNYLGVFAPAGGVNTAVLDNIRGIATSGNMLLVSVGGGGNADAIAAFDDTGANQGNFVANGAGGLVSPFDVFERDSDFLVGGITSDAIHRYDPSGAYIDDLSPLDSFPEQIAEAANGNVLVANFTGSQEGVVELTATGTLVGVYNPPSIGGYRGVYELPNGNILTTNGGGVHEIDRAGNLVETKIDGVSARFISFLPPGITCDPVTITVSIGGPITVTGTPGCVFDLYDSSCDSDPANWVLLASGIVIPDSGTVIVPGLDGMADACYVATVSGDIGQPLNDPVRTVPTLSEWGLIIMASFLVLLAVFYSRRVRTSANV